MKREADSLIQSLAESAFTTNETPTQVRVGLFDIGGDAGTATKNLKRLLKSSQILVPQSISPDDIRAGVLDGFDVVIFPGGYAPKQSGVLGDDGRRAVRKFVHSGGGYVGICGGAFLATSGYPSGLALVNAKPKIGNIDIPGEGMVSITARGAGTVKMELTNAGERVLGSSPGLLSIKYIGGPILSPAGRPDLPPYVSLAVFRSEVWKYQPQQGTMIETSAIIAGRFGKGRVIIFSPHPEMTDGLEFLVRRAVLATGRIPSVHGDP